MRQSKPVQLRQSKARQCKARQVEAWGMRPVQVRAKRRAWPGGDAGREQRTASSSAGPIAGPLCAADARSPGRVFYFYISLSFHSHEQVHVSLLLAVFTTKHATLYLSSFFFYVLLFLSPLRFITARSVPQKLWAEGKRSSGPPTCSPLRPQSRASIN